MQFTIEKTKLIEMLEILSFGDTIDTVFLQGTEHGILTDQAALMGSLHIFSAFGLDYFKEYKQGNGGIFPIRPKGILKVLKAHLTPPKKEPYLMVEAKEDRLAIESPNAIYTQQYSTDEPEEKLNYFVLDSNGKGYRLEKLESPDGGMSKVCDPKLVMPIDPEKLYSLAEAKNNTVTFRPNEVIVEYKSETNYYREIINTDPQIIDKNFKELVLNYKSDFLARYLPPIRKFKTVWLWVDEGFPFTFSGIEKDHAATYCIGLQP